MQTAKSHTGRNVAIGIVFILFLAFFFLVPIVPYASANYIVASGSATVSLSCAVFGVGEVYATGSVLGLTKTVYEWSNKC